MGSAGSRSVNAKASFDGHYFSFKTGGDPAHVVDRFEARIQNDMVTYYRNGPVGCTSRVDAATAHPMESYSITGNKLHGPVSATICKNGDIKYSHGYTSRKEREAGETKAEGKASNVSLGSTPSHGNPKSTTALNTELNNVARNTNDTAMARALVAKGADLASTNGPTWRHTPLHQAAYHGRYEMAKALVEMGAPLDLHSNPCGRGATGIPLELARGGGHERIAKMLEEAMGQPNPKKGKRKVSATGTWTQYSNIDMCGQGDVEIIGNWKTHKSIDDLKRIVEQKGYSAFTVSAGSPSFGHAALKKFPFLLTKEHCKPISTCCRHPCTIYIYTPSEAEQCEQAEKPPVPTVVLSGFHGYNQRLNGEYVENSGESENGRPVFKHMHTEGVGAGYDWCRLYYAHGAWRIGHVMWVHGDNANAVAYCKSSAEHPAEIGASGAWMEHKGQACGQDYGKDERQFKSAGKVVATGEADGSRASNGKAKATASPEKEFEAYEPPSDGVYAFDHCDYGSFDTKGVLYAIGTGFGAHAYENPFSSGKVDMSWSNDAANFYSTQGGHKVGDAAQAGSVICANKHPGFNATMWSRGASGAWFTLDLKSVKLMPTHYAYRNDYGGGGNHPRSFELQGSTDGKSWTTLSQHSGEDWDVHCAKHWPIEAGRGAAYSRFRILNKGSPNHLCCSGIELYGKVLEPAAAGAVAMPVVMGTLVMGEIGHVQTGKRVG